MALYKSLLFFSFNTKLAPGQQTPLLRSPHDDDNSCVPQLANTYRVQPHQHKPSHHASLPSTVRPTVLCKGPQQRPSCTKWSTSIHTVLPDLQIPPLHTTTTPLHSPVRACAATSVGVKDITSQSCCRDSRSARSSNGLQLPSPCHAPSRAASPVPAASRPYDDAMSACHAMSGTLSTFPSAFISQPKPHDDSFAFFSKKKKRVRSLESRFMIYFIKRMRLFQTDGALNLRHANSFSLSCNPSHPISLSACLPGASHKNLQDPFQSISLIRFL